MNSKICIKLFVKVWKSTSGLFQALLSFHSAVSKINKNPKILFNLLSKENLVPPTSMLKIFLAPFPTR